MSDIYDYYPFEGGALRKQPVAVFSERARLPRWKSLAGTKPVVATATASKDRKKMMKLKAREIL